MQNIELLKAYLDILLESETYSLVIRGPHGIGKSKTVLDRLTELGLEEDVHYVYITGYITPLKLYEVLSKSRTLEEPKLFVFDDLDSVFKNKTAVALLKSALAEARGKRIVSYESSAKNVESKSFEFGGKVIIIVNSFTKNSSIEPLLDRGIFYDMEVDPVEMTAYIEEHLKELSGDPLMKDDDIQSVWAKVKRYVDHPSFSLRALYRAFMFYQHDPEHWYKMWQQTLKHQG